MKTVITILFLSLYSALYSQESVDSNSVEEPQCLPREKVIPPMIMAFVIFYKTASVGFEPILDTILKKEDEQIKL